MQHKDFTGEYLVAAGVMLMFMGAVMLIALLNPFVSQFIALVGG